MGTEPRSPITRWLSKTADLPFSLYAVAAAFTTYFCMYAFRKPFGAATYEEVELTIELFGRSLGPKTIFVVSQIIGYCTSKYLGMKFCSEVRRHQLWVFLLGLITIAWLTLLMFAVLPLHLKILAIFCNGLPLGMVWGLVVRYLEGRHTSELLLAGLSCSYILASGEVKSVGKWLMNEHNVAEFWMPFATGAIFIVPFFIAVFLLNQLPAPTERDVELRTERHSMDGIQRWDFLKTFLPGMVLLCVAYFFLTAFRDFRDNYQADMFLEMGITDSDIFSRTERPVAFGVMAALAVLYTIKNNRWGLVGAYIIMLAGLVLMGGATLLYQTNQLNGEWWMILIGLGAYLAYVPYGSVLFDRTIAYTHYAGTAVFAIYLTDAIGYTGSVGIQLYRDLFAGETTRLAFFQNFTYLMSIGGFVLLLLALLYFLRIKPREAGEATTEARTSSPSS